MVYYMHMIYAYLDESGDLGRMGEYFTLLALVFSGKPAARRVSRIIKTQLNGPRKSTDKQHRETLRNCNRGASGLECGFDAKEYKAELKFARLSRLRKLEILKEISGVPDHVVFYITAQKKSIGQLRYRYFNTDLIYYHLASLLVIEMVQCFPREQFQIVFDQRNGNPDCLRAMADHIRIQVYTRTDYRRSIVVGQDDSRNNLSIQAADLLVGAVHSGYVRRSRREFLDIVRPRVVAGIEYPADEFRNGVFGGSYESDPMAFVSYVASAVAAD